MESSDNDEFSKTRCGKQFVARVVNNSLNSDGFSYQLKVKLTHFK